MKIEWLRDAEAHELFWRVLNGKLLRFLERNPSPTVLDVGGDDGSITQPLVDRGSRVVVLDINRDALSRVSGAANSVLADVRQLPFKDGVFDGVAARATLHHVPDDLPETMNEISRVLHAGGLLVLQEPLASNLVYAAARSLFPTTWHDEHERPLRWEEYLRAVQTRFELMEASPHFLLTYAIPFILPRLGKSKLLREQTLARIDRLDRQLLRSLPGVSRYAAYIHILGRKPMRTA